jgi:hypothetical protein
MSLMVNYKQPQIKDKHLIKLTVDRETALKDSGRMGQKNVSFPTTFPLALSIPL